jgi:hypothetical protein
MTDEEYKAWKAQIDLADLEELRDLAHKFLKLAEDSMDPRIRSLKFYSGARADKKMMENWVGWKARNLEPFVR